MKITVDSLSKSFGKTKALDDLSFEMESGAIFGFIGPNGAGKTTALRIMAALDLPDAGDVFYDGVSVIDHPEQARGFLGFMPDTLPESNEILVWEYLDYFARAWGFRGAARREICEKVFAFTHLEEQRDRPLSALSKGMKQQLSLARVLIHDPAVLLLDEPTAGLDPRARMELLALLKQLAGAGKTILISSHILSDLESVANGLVIIDQGKLLRITRVNEVQAAAEPGAGLRLVAAFAADAAAHLAAFEALPGVTRCGIRSPRQLWAQVADEDAFYRAAGAIFERKIPVISLQRSEYSLEELFLASTAGGDK